MTKRNLDLDLDSVYTRESLEMKKKFERLNMIQKELEDAYEAMDLDRIEVLNEEFKNLLNKI